MVTQPAVRTRSRSLGIPSGVCSDMDVLLISASGSWDGQIADAHLPVGHEATRGSAASPSEPGFRVPLATALAADMGV